MALQQARAGLAAVHRAVDGLSSSGVDAARQALTLYRAKRRSLIRSFWLVLLVALLRRLNHAIKEQTPSGEDDASSQAKKSRTQVDLSFFSKLTRILAIVFPRETRIRDTALLGSHTALLVARTAISLYVAALDGRVVSALVKRRRKEFLRGLVLWMTVAIPATFTNSMLSYLQGEIALLYRTRLTNHINSRYMSRNSFYALSNLDDRVKNADQVIAGDVVKFSRALATLYGNLAKPILDIVLYNWQLARNVGGEPLLAMSAIINLSANVMRAMTPPFGKYVAEEAELEGEFRAEHARVIESAEEIAFQRGHEYEKNQLDIGYFSLIKLVNRVLRRRLWHSMVEDFVIKYFWGALGLGICAVPTFLASGDNGAADVTKSLVTNRRLLMSSSDALGRLMYTWREILLLAGYTERVSSFLDVMNAVRRRELSKTLVSSDDRASAEAKKQMLSRRGDVCEADYVEFDHVSIITPNGDLLVEGLTFAVHRGDHLLIVGPNGSGKSSMFRTLGGLWPLYDGVMRKPRAQDLFYIPQKPYFSLGTLRDQVIYPDSREEMQAKGWSDERLLHEVMHVLDLDQLVVREPRGWDAVREWRDALSGGDKQRIAAARLFYHRPLFAILDECTSAVTLDMEQTIYSHAISLGITLMTVSHRTSLYKYHRKILTFDGNKGFSFADLDPEERVRLEEERQQVDAELARLDQVQQRINEIQVAMAEESRELEAPS